MGHLFDKDFLRPVTVVAGHYGVGKTNFSLNVAFDAAQRGMQVTLIDLDVVNPYFRSSDHAEELEARGIRLIAPVFSGPHTSLDVPSLTGAIEPAIEQAYAQAAAVSSRDAVEPQDIVTPRDIAELQQPSVVIIDAGGDDAGATALGRFASDILAGPYAFLYVVNCFRNLTITANQAACALAPIESAAHLRATAVVNNSHLMGDTDWVAVKAALPFGDEVSRLLDVPLLCTTVPQALVQQENGDVPSFMAGRDIYCVQRYVKTPWET